MEKTKHNFLGIYLSKNKATVVCMDSHTQKVELDGCFTVSTEPSDENNFEKLANLIASRCAERNISFEEASIAIDGVMCMCHDFHSEFTDAKQIGSTIKFDAEETVASDINTLAMAFKIVSTGEHGSELVIFTTPKDTMVDVITSFHGNNIDPVVFQPDITALAQTLEHVVAFKDP